eukprot:11241309-Heterocapsa_arctica.AAC.1
MPVQSSRSRRHVAHDDDACRAPSCYGAPSTFLPPPSVARARRWARKAQQFCAGTAAERVVHNPGEQPVAATRRLSKHWVAADTQKSVARCKVRAGGRRCTPSRS